MRTLNPKRGRELHSLGRLHNKESVFGADQVERTRRRKRLEQFIFNENKTVANGFPPSPMDPFPARSSADLGGPDLCLVWILGEAGRHTQSPRGGG
ncbi:hypothetical protein JZ751_029841 [Albula glossodonta]|uniref:Uncharacterized protein n=1 Tax=Albula glossodonta TaxID=121402 RepID=A0A8T2N9I9_9TELE|nr:hypothetical protein JZ751_029841 [Albula glossodonta]